MRLLSVFLFVVFLSFHSFGQERVLTFGLQFKPIVPSSFFRSGTDQLFGEGVQYELTPQFGYATGMVIRRGITKSFSIETGIGYVKRNFKVSLLDIDNASPGTQTADNFGIVGYEVPLLALVYIRLGEQVFMNTAFGGSVDMFPSHVSSADEHYTQLSLRRSWVKLSLLANFGFEYRSEESGIFYLGASFHRPFSSIYVTQIRYRDGLAKLDEVLTNLSGNYLTLDIRYFFNEKQQEAKVKKNKI